jgi:RNA polymerase sigma factor (sigma-70 family)
MSEVLSSSTELSPLHPHQVVGVEKLRAARQNNVNRGYLNWATGLGKTRTIAEDLKEFKEEEPNARALVLCHNAHILDDLRGTFSSVLPDCSHGNVHSGSMQSMADVVYATFQTMNSRYEDGSVLYEAFDPEEFPYVVVDEAHHGPAPTYRAPIKYFKPQILRAATATPERQDQQDIDELFGEPIDTILLEDGIASGYLARPDYRVLTDHVRRFEQIKTNLGDVTLKQLNRLVFVAKRDEEIVLEIAEETANIANPKIVMFCNSIAHAEHMAKLMFGRAAALHSKLHSNKQTELLNMFKEGDLDALITVNKLNEGIHIPGANVAVFLRDTSSRTVFLQQFGRVLAKDDGKERALILDFVATWERIDMLKGLRDNIWNAYRKIEPLLAEPQEPFSFEFSQEVIDAIKVIKTARNELTRKPPSIKIPQRAMYAALAEAMLQADIPEQRVRPEEAQRLMDRIKLNDEAAKQEFISRRIARFYDIASKRADGDPQLTEEYFQEAVTEVMERLSSYDSVTSYTPNSFITYTSHNAITRYQRRQGIFALPSHIPDRLRRIDQAHTKLEQELGRKPTDYEIADKLGMQDDMVIEALTMRAALEDYDTDENLHIFGSQRSMEEILEQPLAAEKLNEVIDALIESGSLTQRHKIVLEQRYGLKGYDPHTLYEVARMLNVTHERVRQLENQAIKTLQSSYRSQSLRLSAGEYDPPEQLTERMKWSRFGGVAVNGRGPKIRKPELSRDIPAMLKNKYPEEEVKIVLDPLFSCLKYYSLNKTRSIEELNDVLLTHTIYNENLRDLPGFIIKEIAYSCLVQLAVMGYVEIFSGYGESASNYIDIPSKQYFKIVKPLP